MNCPYCLSPATRQNIDDELVVSMNWSNDCFDPDVSQFQCDVDQSHVFYADDRNNNAAVENEEDEDAGPGIEIQLSDFQGIFSHLAARKNNGR